MEFGRKHTAKKKQEHKKAVVKPEPKPAPKPPVPKKPEPLKIDDQHHEFVAAMILGGMLGASSNAMDNTKLQPFIDDALTLARQLIETNRNR